ncbi:MAG TPA: B12-binding domain-containing protein, partial [Bacteroidales bacterium]|nr:B12-binding domain-containing protein [Bacteroidales bacterium]
NVSILRRKGYKISQIASMCREELGQRVLDQVRDGSGDRRVEEMIQTMIALDEEGFRDILQTSMVEQGVEGTFTRLIQPFFERIGVMWLAGTINPAQEHFVTNIIRQKLIVAINSLETPMGPQAHRFVLFLPENEMREMALLLYSYIIKRAGHRVLYLGQSTPLGCVRHALRDQEGDVLLTSITSAYSGEALTAYLNQLSGEFPTHRILVTGLQVWQDEELIPRQAHLMRIAGTESLRQFLGTMQEIPQLN